MELHGGDRKSKSQDVTLNLESIGITKMQSSRWQMEAKLDEDVFASKDDAKIWMIDNQNGRRNLTDGWKWELAQAKKLILAERGRERQSHGETAPGKTLLSTIDKSDAKPHNTQQELAKQLGVLSKVDKTHHNTQ